MDISAETYDSHNKDAVISPNILINNKKILVKIKNNDWLVFIFKNE